MLPILPSFSATFFSHKQENIELFFFLIKRIAIHTFKDTFVCAVLQKNHFHGILLFKGFFSLLPLQELISAELQKIDFFFFQHFSRAILRRCAKAHQHPPAKILWLLRFFSCDLMSPGIPFPQFHQNPLATHTSIFRICTNDRKGVRRKATYFEPFLRHKNMLLIFYHETMFLVI